MRLSFRCISILYLVLFLPQQCTSQSKSIEELCYSILPDDYEIYKAPSKNGNAIEVRVALQVMDIDEINEYSMDFRLHSFITTIWNDTRLKLDEYKGGGHSNSLYEKCRHYIWTPDIFFENAKKVDLFENTSPSTILKKRSDGAIVMTKRYSFKAGCEMNFENYPFDHQKCRFLLALMYSSDNIARLKWMGETSYKFEISSIIISRTVQPLQFSLQDSYTYELTETWLEGNFTMLVAVFPLVRRLTGSIVNTFAPSTLIVAMSWVTFWLRADAVPARVALSVTSLLTLCTQIEQSKSQLPPVNYIKAMDIWLFVCIFMVFSTLIEFAISYNLSSQKCDSCSQDDEQTKPISSCCTSKRKVRTYPLLGNEDHKKMKIFSSIRNKNEIYQNMVCQGCLVKQAMATKVDEACRKLFPGIFFVFVFAYWVHYLSIYNSQFKGGENNLTRSLFTST